MQFFEDGYRFGEPDFVPSAIGTETQGELPDCVDVLIVGGGPAGLVLAAQLAAFPGIDTRLVERRDGPLELGQADGVSCRTVEMFESFGLADRLLAEAYWVNETVFWRPDEADRSRIVRTGRVQDVEDGLSEFPHLIVNQARLQQHLLDKMARSSRRLKPDYGWQASRVDVFGDDDPVAVSLRHADGAERIVHARYVVGCDGARSVVRNSIGLKLLGDVQSHAWGVLDVLAVSDFPDYRFKAAIQAGTGRNILIIPREGGYLNRLYVDLGEINDENRATVRGLSADDVLEVARSVFAPYMLDVKDVVWFSIYEVGQRMTEGFDDVFSRSPSDRAPRVFIAGDACHTHSAKAGQGMNVSMQDAFNLGWKLAAVLQGLSQASLLATYSQERAPVARTLIEFDKEWSAMMAAGPKDPAHPERGGVDPRELQAYFVQSGRYTAGVATQYSPALLVATSAHQHLAAGFHVGMRFHSAPVIRIADAKRVELGHVARADGAWRLYVFADRSHTRMSAVCDYLASDDSPVVRFTPAGSAPDRFFDVRGIYQQDHRDLADEELPSILRPQKGRFGLSDYEKAFAPDLKDGPDIFDARGIDRDLGALVVVRPDQFVAHVLPLDDYGSLAGFFDAFMLRVQSPPADLVDGP